MTINKYNNKGTGAEDSGSPSNDLAGASRITPLVYLLHDDPDTLCRAARAQTRMTHTDEATIDSSEFYSRVACLVLDGIRPGAAMEKVAEAFFPKSPLSVWVEQGLQSVGMNSVEAVIQFGQSCPTPEAFPGIVHLIAKYEDNLKEALIQSVMAGGHSAARAIVVGMILGAFLGAENLPGERLAALRMKDHILSLLKRLP